ncbi:hypothetical protein D9611_012893 [Ephemerocybe angulata]|uniref:Alpha-type protein kinase domain-containing protein n=1 Tax=Ephemerocybe angulata TaxID=980116 RepID=A0A8H5F137_9AGAR|nr:hypothetical protein D9611_012893 [Tulosesus angulatus]
MGHKPRTTPISGSSVNTNLEAANKANQVKAERRHKHELTDTIATNIKISAALWQLDEGGKSKEFVITRVGELFQAKEVLLTAFLKLLGRAKAHFNQKYPGNQDIKWDMITVAFHKSASAYENISHLFSGKEKLRTVGELFAECIKQRHVKPAQANNREMHFRLIFSKSDVIREAYDYDDDEGESAYLERSRPLKSKSKLASKRKRNDSVASAPASRPSRPRSSIPTLRSGYMTLTSATTGSSGRSKKWSRDPELYTYHFVKSTLTYNLLTCQKTLDTFGEGTLRLELSADLRCEAKNEGYLGRGSSKIAFYGRIEGQEYAITQPLDPHLDEYEVQKILQAEAELLCECDGFKWHFDDHAKNEDVTLPPFYFNQKGAMMGTIIQVPGSVLPLAHTHFLATPLLPEGEHLSKIRKFTGNDIFGVPDVADYLTQAIQAFAHFSHEFSCGKLIFCDLQGIPDSDGVMCLIDPQVHTKTPPGRQQSHRMYWDQGEKHIDRLMKEHASACKSNKFCNALRLRELIIAPYDEEGAASTSANPGTAAEEAKPKTDSRFHLSHIVT